jgi:hypothetical protein
MKKTVFFANIMLAMLVLTQCQQNKIKSTVREMNKRFPVSHNGLTIEKAEGIDENTIKFYCTIEGNLFERGDSTLFQQLGPAIEPAIKLAGIISIQNSGGIYNDLLKLNAVIIYDYSTPSGKHLFDVKITPDELKQKVEGTDDTSDLITVPQEMFNAIKPKLPITISEETDMVLVDVYVEGKNCFVYVYELPKENMISEDVTEVKKICVETLKSNSAMIKTIENSGLEIRYIYVDKATKKEIANVKITKDDL